MKAATEAAISRRANLIFQSTPPVKAATQWNIVLGKSYQFQSTPPVKAATRLSARERKLLPISIHAAREGGDHVDIAAAHMRPAFQSTPPVKAATANAKKKKPLSAFQSTPPVKAATVTSRWICCCSSISIHAAREGGDLIPHRQWRPVSISIHAAREGGDTLPRCPHGGAVYFNPRRP
mgnify:CR=1 FL=1